VSLLPFTNLNLGEKKENIIFQNLGGGFVQVFILCLLSKENIEVGESVDTCVLGNIKT